MWPPPWSVEDIDAAFVVKDSSGQKVAYVYYEEEPGRRSAAKLLTDEARRLNYTFPKEWPTDREVRARIIGGWLQAEAESLA